MPKCAACRDRTVAEGSHTTASYARDLDLCLICYRLPSIREERKRILGRKLKQRQGAKKAARRAGLAGFAAAITEFEGAMAGLEKESAALAHETSELVPRMRAHFDMMKRRQATALENARSAEKHLRETAADARRQITTIREFRQEARELSSTLLAPE